jgi:AcrR family transcriptional regulator
VTDLHLGPRLGQPLPSDARAERIVAAALAVFAEKGFEGARLADIARRAGTTTPALRRHFVSKEELFRDVVRTTLLACACDAEHDRSLDLLGPDRSAADALRELARRYWSAMEHPERIAILRLVVAELPRFPELAVLHATEALERFLHSLEHIIAGGVARGELRAVDVRAASRSIVATLAAHALWFAYPGVYAGLTGADPARAAARTIETIVCALEPLP